MGQKAMSARRRARQFALQALYQADLTPMSAEDALGRVWASVTEDEGIEGVDAPKSSEVEFATRLVEGVLGQRDELDALIESCSTTWRIPRMPLVDRNILRIGAFELAHCPDVPGAASINEAVELAKSFGTRESRAFINGIVDGMGRKLGRVERRKGKRS